MTTDLPTFIEVPVTATERYWDNFSIQVNEYKDEDGANKRLLVTHRTGATGRSDAQYIVDRLASGLFFGAKIIEVEPKHEPVDISMFVSAVAEGGTYAVNVHANDGSGLRYKLPLGRLSCDRALLIADCIVSFLKKGWV